MTHSNGKEKYYYCRTGLVQNNCACTEVHIPQKDLLAALLGSLRAQAAVAVDLNRLCQEQRESKAFQLWKLITLHEKEGQIHAKSKALYEHFALREISREEYLTGKGTLASQKATVAGQIQQLEAVLDETEQPTNVLHGKADGLGEHTHGAPIAQNPARIIIEPRPGGFDLDGLYFVEIHTFWEPAPYHIEYSQHHFGSICFL